MTWIYIEYLKGRYGGTAGLECQPETAKQPDQAVYMHRAGYAHALFLVSLDRPRSDRHSLGGRKPNNYSRSQARESYIPKLIIC